MAGHPDEYFLTGPPEAFPPDWRFWEEGPLAQAHGVTDRRSYLDLVYRLGSTPNGVFGAKLMWNNVVWVVAKFTEMPEFSGMTRSEVFGAVFPDLRVIHLVRHDRVRQAVSWARAAQEGVWLVSETEPARPVTEPHYDFEFISNLEGLIRDGEEGWHHLYAELGVVPHEVVYEDLTEPERYSDTVTGVLNHLGLEADVIPAPRTHRRADHVNDKWAERYLADRARHAPK